MTVIRFNIENKNSEQIKREIIGKFSKLNKSFTNDMNYFSLFYDVVLNANKKKNVKISFDNYGNYSIGGREPINNNEGKGFLNKINIFGKKEVKPEERDMKPKEKATTDEEEESSGEPPSEEEGESSGEPPSEEEGESSGELPSEEEGESSGEPPSEEEGESSGEPPSDGEEESNGEPPSEEEGESSGETTPDENTTNDEKESLEETTPDEKESPAEETTPDEKTRSAEGTTPVMEEKSTGFFSNLFGLKGGATDSSDDEILSSDDEKFTSNATNIFFDDNDGELLQHIKNMRSKKYLRSLHNDELRNVLKNNNLPISGHNNYLNKEEMVKSIIKFYK